jgi:lipopolysaccharide export system permease protein
LKQIDRLIIREVLGPWIFGVAMFAVVLIATEFLQRMTNYLVQGIAFGTVIEVTCLFLPGILVKTFAMSMLLAGLLGFGRLSGDSEIIAMRAAGASIGRIVRPVAIFALAVAIVAFAVDETLVPTAAKESVKLTAQIAKQLNPKAMNVMSYPISSNGKVIGVVTARNYDAVRQVLIGATVVAFGPNNRDQAYLSANELAFDPTKLQGGGGWRIQGGSSYQTADGSQHVTLTGDTWPSSIPHPNFNPEDILASLINDPDVLSMKEIQRQVAQMLKRPDHRMDQVANLQFWYWNKVALPLYAVIYGILGAPLGIRRSRTPAAAGFALAIVIIFVNVMLGNWLNVGAMGGVYPAWVASMAPLAAGLIAAVFIIRSRNS